MRSLVQVAAVVGLAAGCVVVKDKNNEGEPPGPGTVDISWQLGPSGCEVAGVTDVQVDIGGVGGTFACADESASLTVPAGSYELTLTGLDGQAFARYEGVAHNVVVSADRVTTVPTVVLSALPASVSLTWYFENGKLCAANQVDTVEAVLYDQDFAVDTLDAPCDDGALLIEDVQPGDYVLSVLGRDVGGVVNYGGETPVTLGKGDTLDVEVALSPM